MKKLLIAHRDKDESAFASAAESIANELIVENRPGEAKMIKAIINEQVRPKMDFPNLQLLSTNKRSGESIIAIPNKSVSRHQIFLNKQTAIDIDRVIEEHRSRLELARFGLHPASKLLFWGPPGCGKTITAQMIASELAIPFGLVRLSSLITSFVGETAANLHRTLSAAAASPLVLLLDEADAVAKDREDRNDVGELKRVVNSLLQAMDEFSSDRSILILASNHQHLIDSAIWRRFDNVIEFSLPDNNQRREYLQYLTSGCELRGSLAELSKNLANFSFADIERCVINAQKSMILDKKGSILSTLLIKAQANLLQNKRMSAQTAGRKR